MGRAEIHNALTREFVELAGRETKSAAELMVVLESVITASMLLAARLHHPPPHVAAGMVEAAIQRAIERFAGQIKGVSK